MKEITKQDILSCTPTIKSLRVDRLSGPVFVREMSGKQRDEYQEIVSKQTIENDDGTGSVNMDTLKARLIIRCVCDKDGKLLFDSDDAIPEIEGLASVVVDQLFDFIRKLNGIGEEEEEILEKN